MKDLPCQAQRFGICPFETRVLKNFRDGNEMLE